MKPSVAINFVKDYLEGDELTHDPEATRFGVVQSVYDSYRKLNGKANRSVSDIEEYEAIAIYNGNFWMPMKCSSMPDGVDLALFQFGVNAGSGRAVKVLQDLVGVVPDGVVGPKTIAAVNKIDPAELTEELLDAQDRYYDSLYRANPTRNAPYIQGWHNRVAKVKLFLATGLGQGGFFSIVGASVLALLLLLVWWCK